MVGFDVVGATVVGAAVVGDGVAGAGVGGNDDVLVLGVGAAVVTFSVALVGAMVGTKDEFVLLDGAMVVLEDDGASVVLPLSVSDQTSTTCRRCCCCCCGTMRARVRVALIKATHSVIQSLLWLHFVVDCCLILRRSLCEYKQ